MVWTVPLNRNSVEYLNVLVERIRENNPQTIIQVGQYQNIYIHTFIKIKKLKIKTETGTSGYEFFNFKNLVLAISGRLLKSFRHRICFKKVEKMFIELSNIFPKLLGLIF